MRLLVHAASLIVLAFALSLDSFGVGMTYGIRKLRIPWLSIVIISVCSGLIILLSMQVGSVIIHWFSDTVARWIGSFILIAIGCFSVIQLVRSQPVTTGHEVLYDNAGTAKEHCSDVTLSSTGELNPSRPVIEFQLRRLGIIIQILRTPQAADIDRSGTISAAEAAWLGVALSLDAFGAGIGAALLGFAPILTAIVIALFSGSFLLFGIRLGIRFAEWSWIRKLSFLPGCLLIIMGIMKLF
ncbi:MntP/YtaF family protein [Paenibacillus sp. ACRRX]|uniref:MntP/YtaF family protein n=1 Tax=Paenibacillus sp. ACRRX TaxID=2918206 RepID=UPI0031BA58CC